MRGLRLELIRILTKLPRKTVLMISTTMTIVATAHLTINFYRYLLAFRRDSAPHTPEIVLTSPTWHSVAKDVLFLLQELLGSSLAVRLTSSCRFH